MDVFRGATVAFMILVNNQFGTPYPPLDHAAWHGLTPTDLVFPFFLFAMGNAQAFVVPRLLEQGTAFYVGKSIRRAALIFAIGFLLSWFPFFRWDHDRLILKGWTWINDSGTLSGVRIMGVLGRIGLCYLGASLILAFATARQALGISCALLLGYWLLTNLLGDKNDPYNLSGFVGTSIDKYVLGEPHLYHGEGTAFDPEGLWSTLPAITSVIAGYLAGRYIRQKGKSDEMLSRLLLAGLALLLLGYCWNMVFPVNKKIWSSSYAVCSAGFALVVLAFFIFLIEFRGNKGGWSRFFNVFGKNPLFIFVLSGVLPRLAGLVRISDGRTDTGKVRYTQPFTWFYQHVSLPVSLGNAKNASLLFALLIVGLYWSVAYWLDRKKIYIKV